MERNAFARRTLTVVAVLSLLVLPVAYFLRAQSHPPAEHAEEALKHYLKAVYARDFQSAYRRISQEDRKEKSLANYLRENPTFSGPALHIARRLADHMELRDIRVEKEGRMAVLRFRLSLPDANDPILQKLLLEFDPERLNALSPG